MATEENEIQDVRRTEQGTDRIIALENVWLTFDKPILRGVSLAAHESDTLLIAGESGTGKTTILRLVLRLLVPEKGRVMVHERDITRLSFAEALSVRQKMGMVFQGAALFDSLTVFENVAYPLREHREMDEEAISAVVRQKLEVVDLEPEDVQHRLPAELSGGMKKRVGIARALANEPEIMLYDEPTAGLDPITTGTIVRLIAKLQRDLGVTSVVVSHDLRATLPIATKVAILADQSMRFVGTPSEMRATDDVYVREFLGVEE
jgi:phospholipid/cholesterol/gamma-HCH transport system ATP-binding protein